MTRWTWTAALLAAAGLTAALTAETTAPVPSPAAPAPAGTRQPVGKVSGTAGCGAIACHGGPIGAPDARGRYVPESKNSFTWWSLRDKHSRAYEVLLDPRSVRMMVNLGVPQKDAALAATKDARCLACHTVPQSVLAADGTVADSPEVALVRSEGVSCEGCHGPAEAWKAPHTSLEWQQSNGPERRKKYDDTGMVWLNDLQIRARVCVGCHVGAPAEPAKGIPVRDVNHDLIAAGHPKLSFEMLSYTENEPPHWLRRDRSQRYDASELVGAAKDQYDAKLWLVGQIACAEGAVRLLEDRLNCDQPRPAAPEWERDRRWPELAEYECYGCHHNLVAPSWRQTFLEYYSGSFGKDPDANSFSTKARKPGSLVWASWNVSKALEAMADKRVVQSVAELRRVMGGAYPKPKAVKPLADKLQKDLSAWLDQVNKDDSAQAVLALQNAIPAEVKDYAGMSWDDAAQIYLACEALARAKGDATYMKARQQLVPIRNALRLPRPQGGDKSFYDSPVKFLPRPLSQQKLADVKEPALPALFARLRNQTLVPPAE